MNSLRQFSRYFALLLPALLLIGVVPLGAVELHVATTGDDSNPGSAAKPFASLEGARNAVRSLIKKGLDDDVVVAIHGGQYELERTVVFGLDDSAPTGRTITYAAADGEEPVFTSCKAIGGWKKLTDAPATLPKAAHGKVWVANVPKGDAWRFKTLYDGETRLPRARSEALSGTKPRITREKRWTDLDSLYFAKGDVKDWDNLEDVELLMRPNHVWIVNYLPLASVDVEDGVAKTAIPATYNQNPIVRRGKAPHYWVENTIDVLDSPGEWALNTKEGRLYYWPADGTPSDAIAAPRLSELILAEGKNVDALDGDVPVQGLIFSGLTLTGGERDVWTPDDKGIQHDWEMWDKANCLIRFRGARACAVIGCELRNSAGGGIRIDRYGQEILIGGNSLYDLGGTGVLLCGYGPGLKDVNKGNVVVNNNIQKIAQVHMHNLGVFIWQSGENKIVNNRIHDTPYDAIVLSGVRPRYFNITDPVKWKNKDVIPRTVRENMQVIRWDEVGEPASAMEALKFAHARNNIVEDNEVHDAMQLLGDGNAIYLSCAGEGNVVRRNLTYNCPRAGSTLRFDDDQEQATIEDNIVFGTGLTLKHTNFIYNNVFIGGSIRVKNETAPGCKVERNIFYMEKGGEFMSGADPAIKKTGADRNFYSSGEKGAAGRFLAKLRKLGLEKNGANGNAGFVDLKNGDVSLRPDSSALKVGFKPIDVSKIGLLDDPAYPRVIEEGLVSTATSGELLGAIDPETAGDHDK